MSRGAVLRVAAYNLVVALFVLAERGTVIRALFSALTLGTAEVAGCLPLSWVLSPCSASRCW